MSPRQILLLAGLCLPASYAFAQTPAADYTLRPDRVFLLNVADTGDGLVAVGERGVVLLADASGDHWTSTRTSTTRTLAGVAFTDARHGIAVGHGGALLKTEDGGRHWQAIDAETNGDALLGVAAMGEGRMVAWGAFGLYLMSADNGVTWQRHSVLGDDFDRHISQIIALANGDWLLVGESGTLARSADHGQSWQAMASPYAGSLFGALQLNGGGLLIYGMRGNLWYSADAGQSWEQRQSGTTFALNGAVELKSGHVLVMGNSGLLLSSDDQGGHFSVQPSTHASLARAIERGDGRLLAVGDHGVMTLPQAKPQVQD
ncbi:YCF48-related protein [Pseudomonas sp. GD04087]|uniref:WD40/YVTN/BNR-like repeat-containing protein n=1 Tax=unclassified Pseudomonas TaxID=196821 RepID=UPI00244AD245|nr:MULTISPECIES: YCF48-related protein [unclassified Pseudomonas]MDH0293116.1 YCF48-related protein [Pseudomonas sp. GD04087]MDH1052811.1 YCF48-related protein [Pseudomonas sp. GD03903]MDH2003355.1 YCF48-related protein [Pseudomonas sp. GD03691]